jgi:putative copper resistance protein D
MPAFAGMTSKAGIDPLESERLTPRSQENGLDPLIWVRAVHFAATVSVSGVVFFLAWVGEPAFRMAAADEAIAALVRRRLAGIAWISLAAVVLTGVAWLVLLAKQMSERPLAAMWSEGVLRTVLLDTDFGNVWLARSVLVVLVALAWGPFPFAGTPRSPWRRGATLAFAAALVGALAFAGHAASGEGVDGIVQEAADFLHLVAAAAWVGALLPLAVVLGAAQDRHGARGAPAVAIARAATLRFSTLGIVSVAIVLATGIVNSWERVGSVAALVGTDYGRLLSVKVALFLVMLAVAAVNRLQLTPRLVQEPDAAAQQDALRQLRRNALVEAGLGAIILVIVASLGMLPPPDEQTSREGAATYPRLVAGTGTPGIFTRTEPSAVRLVKYSVFQSSPPNAMLVVCGLPWTMRPSFRPCGSMT